MAGLSTLKREMAEREAAERLARAVTLEALDGVLSFARREQLAERLTDEETALIAGLATTVASTHTLRALAGDLEFLSLWHRAETENPLPFPPDEALVLRAIESMRAADPAPSHATLRRRITSWTALVRAAGSDDAAFAAPAIRAALSGRMRARAKTERLGADGLARLIAACDGEGLTDCRDRALLLTAFTLQLGPAEIAALKADHLQAGNPPQLLLAAPSPASTDDAPALQAVDLPDEIFTALDLWRSRAGLATGPLFRPVDRWGKVGRLGLTPQSVKLVVRARAGIAGLDPTQFSALSLR